MGNGVIKIRYYRVRRNGMAFWEPTKTMRDMGFANKALGPDGPEAWAAAHDLNKKYDEAKAGLTASGNLKYLPGTLGSWYEKFKTTKKWEKKARRTRGEWDTYWEFIHPHFKSKLVHKITAADFETFQIWCEENLTETQRFKSVKILRALFQSAIDYNVLSYHPAKTLSNPIPAGRSAFWHYAEYQQLLQDARSAGFHGLAIALQFQWQALRSPVDSREVTLRQIEGDVFRQSRAKTGKSGIWILPTDMVRDIEDYVECFGAEILPSSPLPRMRSGGVYQTKDSLGKDFRKVRKISFPNDKRQMLDFRRSANLEAAVGNADPKDRAAMLANSVDKNRALDAVYTPPNRAQAADYERSRNEGRKALHSAYMEIKNRG